MTKVLEGTGEEIASQVEEYGKKRLRVIIISEDDTDQAVTPPSLSDLLKGRLGRFDFGGVNLSSQTSRKFSELLEEKRREGHL